MTTETGELQATQGGTGAETLTIIDNRTGLSYEVPIKDGTIRATELRKIKVGDDDFGIMTYDPAYMNTASCRSAVTFIDGERGILEYRGYPIEELAEKSTYLEVAYLLVHGKLPTQQELDAWTNVIRMHTFVHEDIREFIKGFRYDAHPMGMLEALVGALSTFFPEASQVKDPVLREIQVDRLLAKMPTLAAFAYRHRLGMPLVYPDNELSYAANFLSMLFRSSETHYEPDPRLEHALDVLFILHADHEQNCSTSAVRSVGSSQVNPFSAVASGIAALYGPLHGGANEEAWKVLEQVGSPDKAEAWIQDALARKERIMGFGHRVYKTGDPRARILKQHCIALAKEVGEDKWERIAEPIEQAVTSQKNLPPNVDWPSARLYHYMGLEIEIYTPIFAMARVAGWAAHIIEQLDHNRLMRPRAIYTGPPHRAVKPIEQRS